MKPLPATPLLVLASAAALAAQDADVSYVLESMSYVTVGDYAAGGANVVDVSATTDGQENAISLDTFTQEMAAAFAAGTGGVIDFEVDLPGNSLLAIDRTLVTGYLRPVIDQNVLVEDARRALYDNLSVGFDDDPYTGVLDGLDGSDEAFWYDSGLDPVEKIVVPESISGYSFDPPEGSSDIGVDPAPSDATGFLMVDPARVIRVEDRRDREYLDKDRMATVEGLGPVYATLRGIYGTNNENAVSIRRGPMHISEDSLATRDSPGEREFTELGKRYGGYGTINDEFWFRTGFSTGGGLTILNEAETFHTAVSGERILAGGGINDATAKDLLFDPRDNIVKLGLTLLSHGNFQFWQGLSAEPDNANNILVKVWFSDGTTTDYRGTTQQSNAGADTFFGFEAPDGAAVTRMQMRVVGRNYRTFTNIDDIGFITGPSAPYISRGAEPSLTVPSAARDRGFVRALEFQRSPDTVEIPGLDALGLALDLETGLITGTVDSAAPDEITLDAVMTNADGTRTEKVNFVFADPVLPPTPTPVEFSADVQTLATLGRDYNYTLTANLNGVGEEDVEFFVVARRVVEIGDNPVVSLGDLGFSLSDNVLSGIALRGSSAGDYDLSLYAMTPEGASGPYVVRLKIVPPTPEPNFDGLFSNLQTDLVLFDPAAGTLSVSLFSTDGATGEAVAGVPVEIATGLPADTRVFLGEFNGDGNTDLLTFSASNGLVRVFAMSGSQASAKTLRNWGPGSAWRVLGVGDLNIDGIADVIIDNPASGVQYAWILRPLNVGNPPLSPIINFSALIFTGDLAGNYELLTIADFNGDGGSDLLWRNLDSGFYVITPFNDSTFTGSYGGIESIKRTGRTVFTMEPGFVFLGASDVSGDGLDDLLWRNAATGAVAVWKMTAAAVPSGLFEKTGSGGGYDFGIARAGTGGLIIDDSIGVPTRQVDLNNDNKADLVIENAADGTLRLILLDGDEPKGAQLEFMEDGKTLRPRQLRGDGDGLRAFQVNASKTLLDNFPVPGELPLALEPDEALFDYRIFEQKRDDKDNLVWSIPSDGFHATPVADTTKPIAGRDVFLDGMHVFPGEALRDYTIYQRDGDDALGRPKVKVSGGFIPIPQQKRVNKPRADAGTPDRVWSPMETALDGSPFVDGVDGIANHDARGNRGFLQVIDATGQPVFEDGEPVYELWRNANGLTVEEQSTGDAIADSIRAVIGGASGAGFWVAGSELSPVAYLAAPPAGVSAADFLYGNRRAVTNAIIEAIELAAPLFDFPDSALLPVDPGAYDPAGDLIDFDVVLTANENAIAAAAHDAVVSAAAEVFARADAALFTPLYDPATDPLETQYAAIESAVAATIRMFSRDAAGFTAPQPVFTEEQLDVAVRRAITAGIRYGVEQAGLVPAGLGGVSFELGADDIKLFLSGNESSDILDMKYAMVEALYVAAEKLQGLAVRAAVADAVKTAFSASVAVADIPLDLVSRTGDVFERLDEAEKEASIENAIIVGIQLAAQVTVTGADLDYVFVEAATGTAKAQAIVDAIDNGITAAGGSWAPVPFTWPKDVTTVAGDLVNGYREANSLEQNAAAIQQATAFASNRETGGSLTGTEPGYPEFVYFTNAELADRVELILDLALDDFGGKPDATINPPADPASPEPAIRRGIFDSVTNAYLDFGAINANLVFPQGADAAAQSLAARQYIVRVIKGRFYRSNITASDFPLAYSDADPLVVREAAVEEGIRLAIAQELPDASFADTAAAIPGDLTLFDAAAFVALGNSFFAETARKESVAEALTAAVAAAQGFFPLPAPVPLSIVTPTAIADNIALNVSTSAFGSLNESGSSLAAVYVPRVEFSVGYTSAVQWQVVRGAIVRAVNNAFPAVIDASVLDGFGSDPFAGLDFDARGGIVLEAVAEALTAVSGNPVSVADIESAAFPADYLLFDLDYDRDPGSFGGITSPGDGFELVGTGDFDNQDSRRDGDLVFFNPDTGEYVIYLMRGVELIGRIRLGGDLTLFEAWQYRNFSDPAPGEGLLSYAQGVEDVADPADGPAPVAAYRIAGGVHDGAFAIEFDFRIDDPDLGYVLEGSDGLRPVSWAPVASILVDEVPVPGRPANRRVIRPDEPPAGERFYRIRFTLGVP